MTRTRTPFLAAALGAALALPVLATLPAAAAEGDDYEVLVVGKTLGFRHSSIDEATTAIIGLGEEHGFTVDVWDPAGQPERSLTSTPFTTKADLDQYETVVFVSTVDGTNNMDPSRATILDAAEQDAFQAYLLGGGGFAGVHAATDSMHTVPWYSQLTGGGARFIGHPQQQEATQVVEDHTHPSTEHLGDTWVRFDEWYNFSQSPREQVRVLTNLDETTYNPGRSGMGEDHPLAWCHNYEGVARSWYTGGGHTEASYLAPDFLEHLLGGIEWSAGQVDGGGDCVTWYEVDTLLADLVADGDVTATAADRVTKQLERSQGWAEAGDHARSASRLASASAQVRAHVRDDDAAARLQEKIADLVTWQRATA